MLKCEFLIFCSWFFVRFGLVGWMKRWCCRLVDRGHILCGRWSSQTGLLLLLLVAREYSLVPRSPENIPPSLPSIHSFIQASFNVNINSHEWLWQYERTWIWTVKCWLALIWAAQFQCQLWLWVCLCHVPCLWGEVNTIPLDSSSNLTIVEASLLWKLIPVSLFRGPFHNTMARIRSLVERVRYDVKDTNKRAFNGNHKGGSLAQMWMCICVF